MSTPDDMAVSFPANCSKTFLESFHVVNTFHRLLGYSFLHKLQEADSNGCDVICNRRSTYAIYATISWVVLITVFAYDSYEVLKMFDDTESFEKGMTLAYSIRTLIIQVFSFCAIIVRAPKLARLANCFGELEQHLSLPMSLKTSARLIVLLNVALAVVLFVSIVPLLFLFAEYTMSMMAWNIFYGIVCLFHGQAACIISYTWLMFYSKVLACYIDSINNELRGIQGEDLDDEEVTRRARNVGDLHRLFYQVMEAFWKCQDIYGLSLFIVVPLNLIVAAPWTYFVIKQLHRPEVSLINALGCVALCAQMVIVALFAVLPNKEAKETWTELTKILVCVQKSRDTRKKIEEFRHTCVHQEFRFSALGFFKVGPPLVVSITSAIIAYTVILYQSDVTIWSANGATTNYTP